MDILFVAPGNSSAIYQELSNDISAIEPPTWALILAQSCRSKGHGVGILDVNAERMSNEEAYDRIHFLAPRIICFVVYGQNVNAGTTQMSGAISLANHIKSKGNITPICFVGSYVQAVPKKALEDEPSIDFAFTNEGVYALWQLLDLDEVNVKQLDQIEGIVWRKNGHVVMNPPSALVPNDRMDIDMPGYAWDLLPFKEKPLDLYRSSLWHARFDEDARGPYAAIQTSLGCKFGCGFCMINIVNRNDNAEIGVASNYSGMRFWSPEFIIKEFDKLVEMGVRVIRIIDEMFLLNKNYYVPLCTMLKERGYGDILNMWAYSRIDTVADPAMLDLVRDAGIKGLCLGIESGNRKVRLEVTKGKFQDVDVERVIRQIHDAGMEVLANYMFGLPGDNLATMQQTLDLSLKLCTSGWNAYAAMALPGSHLYKMAIDNGYPLPRDYSGYSFHSYDTQPMPTKACSAAEILAFRDRAFHIYHEDPRFLARIERLFGPKAVATVKKMASVKLRRRIVEEAQLYG